MGRIYPEVEKLLEELKSRQVFDADFNKHLPIRKTFHGVINQILEMKHCNSVMFCEKTDLNKTIFSDLKKKDYKPIKRIVVTICIGFKLEYSISEELLRLAGYELVLTREIDYAYYLFMTEYRHPDMSIEDYNKLLEHWGFDEKDFLGSLTRKTE